MHMSFVGLISEVCHNLLVLAIVYRRDSYSSNSLVLLHSKLYMLLSVLELLLINKRWQSYQKHRTTIAVAQRAVRLLANLGMTVQSGFDVMQMGGLAPSADTSTPAALLISYMLVPPIMWLIGSFNFLLPTGYGLLLQPMTFLMMCSWSWRAPAGMRSFPGVLQLATKICSSMHTSAELLLGAVTWLGVRPEGLESHNSTCSSAAVLAQLMLYYNFVVCLLLPLCFTYVAELHHKIAFWRHRGCRVVVRRSVLLPLPEHLWMSHAAVVAAALLVTWFVVEQVAPFFGSGVV
jgi:hypothetical protein